MSQHAAARKESRQALEAIVKKAQQRVLLSRADMTRVLGLTAPDLVQDLFRAARQLRKQSFGNRIFLYGFLYFSTYCRNSCGFCLYRKNNSSAIRYRKSRAEIMASCHRLSESGIHLMDLTMGEDPDIFQTGDQGFEVLLETIRSVKKLTDLPIMISAGVLPAPVLDQLSRAGATWYACYQETHNRTLYQKLRLQQDYDLRINSKRHAKAQGLLIEEGLLVGVGESDVDIADSILVMRDLRADQVRAMSFVPQTGTPMAHCPSPNPLRALLVIALLRLAFPECLIPASLDVGGRAGLHQKLAAGANVVTSLIPPGHGLAGVAESELDIEQGRRTVTGIQSILAENGLEAASGEAYQSWLDARLKTRIPSPR